MNTVFFNFIGDDQVRRQHLFKGQIFVFSPRPSSIALIEFARSMVREAFGSLDPVTAQYHMPVEQYVAIVAPLKPAFIHHPETMKLLRAVIQELGCGLETTYLDVPRLRMVTSDGYLTAGVGYAHHPHRDTWYSAPMAQLNWWVPIYDFESESSMAFHPRYWDEAVENGSAEFNYYEWNSQGRKHAAQHVKTDTRKQPKAKREIELQPEIRIVCPPGGIILFSAAQMHSTIPNTSGRTRYSLDFRTVNIEDLASAAGAPNVDSSSTGTSLRDFVRASDFAALPDDLVRRYDTSPPVEGELVFNPRV
jgi:hypothetical protein